MLDEVFQSGSRTVQGNCSHLPSYARLRLLCEADMRTTSTPSYPTRGDLADPVVMDVVSGYDHTERSGRGQAEVHVRR